MILSKISRRFALRIEPVGLIESLTTAFVRAEIDRQQQNRAISERNNRAGLSLSGR
jgi:hypothetical protein